MKRIGFFLVLFPLLISCAPKPVYPVTAPAPEIPGLELLPEELSAAIAANRAEFLADLEATLAADASNLLVLVDKQHSLTDSYAPSDLVDLAGDRSYTLNRDDLSLRVEAEQSLEEMARAARAEGITLLVSSTYRSYNYQAGVYQRNVQQLGQAAADRESARPGTSQHQLGTAVDFGSITDAFAQTAAGRWLAANAHRFGWSLSFPDGYEAVTGYRWESWHYRYIGKQGAALQAKWFGNVQQYMMEFIDAWRSAQGR